MQRLSPTISEAARRAVDAPTVELERRISEVTGAEVTLTPEVEAFLRAALRFAASR